jgi:mono/diheme cytochrome c family protein
MKLARSRLLVAAIGGAILLVIGVLAAMLLAPQVLPSWPFPVRFSGAAFGDPELRTKLLRALWSIAAGLVLGGAVIVIGVVVRCLRWYAVAAGVAIAAASIAGFAPVLSVLTVEAFPTTFYRSPTSYSASSIERGAELFAIHCASCHGKSGRGDGPAGRFFRTKPSDLTADHVYGHTDGDLYWWIVNGIREVMPPFGAALDEEARWNVIDFVRANADGSRIAPAPAKVTDVGYRAPNFSAQCADGSTVTRDRLRGRIAHLIIGSPASAERVAQLASRDRDVVTVVVPLDGAVAGPACRVDDAELAKALAIFRSKDAAAAIAETELLVDGSGALRAVWFPGGKPDWRDAEVLQREIAAIRANPVATRTMGSHLHMR